MRPGASWYATVPSGRPASFAACFAAAISFAVLSAEDVPACMAAPVSYLNDIARASQIDNFISINGAVDIDLFGQVNAESAGVKHISGAGGQLDFVLGAYLSNGGKSFICLSSTFMNKKTGKVENLSAILEEAGSGLANVVKSTCFMADLADFAEFNAEYAKHFTSNPARECVQVAALPKAAQLEVSVIATLNEE